MRPIVRRAHRSPVATTIGWVCWAGLVFDAARTKHWLDDLAGQRGNRRLKAVLRTNEGWRHFNIADGAEKVTPSEARVDSRLELVIESERPPEPDVLEQQLRACLTAPIAADGQPPAMSAPDA